LQLSAACQILQDWKRTGNNTTTTTLEGRSYLKPYYNKENPSTSIDHQYAGSDSQYEQQKFEGIAEILRVLTHFQNTDNAMRNNKRMSAVLANVFLSFKYPFHSTDEVDTECFWPHKCGTMTVEIFFLKASIKDPNFREQITRKMYLLTMILRQFMIGSNRSWSYCQLL